MDYYQQGNQLQEGSQPFNAYNKVVSLLYWESGPGNTFKVKGQNGQSGEIEIRMGHQAQGGEGGTTEANARIDPRL
jgi:hypothetical protein